MGAPSDTKLTTFLRTVLSTKYKRTDVGLNPETLKDDLTFSFDVNLVNGRGTDKANLQWYDRRTLVDDTELLDLDGVLTNKWNQILDFDAVKILLIKNRETDQQRYLDVTFKNDRYIIGAGGLALRIEPVSFGVQSTVSSSSQEEGNITITAVGSVSYDIIIIGASGEQSSSSGV